MLQVVSIATFSLVIAVRLQISVPWKVSALTVSVAELDHLQIRISTSALKRTDDRNWSNSYFLHLMGIAKRFTNKEEISHPGEAS
jgi:hypothetical protein